MGKMNKTVFQRAIIIFAVFALSYAIILGSAMPETYEFEVGGISPADIYAPRDVEDTVTTQKQIAAATEQVAPQYKIDFDVNNRLTTALGEFFTLVINTSQMEGATAEQKANIVKSSADIELGSAVLNVLAGMSPQDLAGAQKNISELLTAMLDEGITDAAAARAGLSDRVRQSSLTFTEKTIANAVLPNFIEQNKVYDEEATNAAREKAKEMVTPTVYKKNQAIVRRGEQVKDYQLAMLKQLGYVADAASVSLKYSIGIGLFLLIAFAMLGIYVYAFNRDIFRDQNRFLLAAVVFSLMMAMLFFIPDGADIYLIPIAVGAILLSIFIDIPFAVLVHVVLSICAAIILKGDLTYLVAMLFSGSFAAVAFKRATTYGAFSVSTLIFCGVQALVFVTFALVENASAASILQQGGAGVANGILTSIIAIGTMPFFEMVFDIITPLKLSELASPERKLLKRLLFEAPGTYHHSLMVGNLAEAACREIGGNELLARVGAYYHDIGKLKRPVYFKENQLGENPHDRLMPEESAAILLAHPKDGMDVARQYRLPDAIVGIILQHHGTTVTGMFYQKAAELYGEKNVDKQKYCYRGPKPQTKEAAAVMLADSCEAAVRSLDDKSDEEVEKMVRKIVRGRLLEGQLDESDLTLRDLEKVIKAFVAMFAGYFHRRIKYEEKAIEKANEKINEKAMEKATDEGK